CQQHNGYPLTF
nr:immunoglobulin light chain junction region [Macaca mulatta]